MKNLHFENTGLNDEVMTRLEKIAMECAYCLEERGDIKGRGGDSEDFMDMSVYSIQKMLAKAYEMGRRDA